MSNNGLSKNLLGGANQEALKNICTNAIEVTQEDDVAPFDMDWHQIFSRWVSGENALSDSLILIFSDNPQVLGVQHNFKTIFQFGVSDSVQPGVYLVGRSPNSNAWQIPNSGNNHQSNCESVLEVGLGDTAAVVLGINSGNVVYLPNGVNGCNWLLKLSTTDSPLDDPTLTAYLENFTEENLNSQETRGDLWENASQWIPTQLAEKAIQKMLVIGLRTAFLEHVVLAETTLTNGRTDLWIKSRNSSSSENIILELKVVRSKHSSGTDVADIAMINHLDEGVTQAREYRKKVGGTAAYLCVYDMRAIKGGTVISTTTPKCIASSVSFKVFDVDNSSKSTRQTAALAAV